MIAFIGGITNFLTRYDQGIIPIQTNRVIQLILFRKPKRVALLIGFVDFTKKRFRFFFIFLNKLKKKTNPLT